MTLKQRLLTTSLFLTTTLLMGRLYSQYEIDHQKMFIPTPDMSWIVPKAQAKEQTIDQMLVNAFGSNAPLMRRIMMCESGGNPNAMNKKSSATGLFQIMASVHGQRKESLKDPIYNIWYSKKLFMEQGTRPWWSSRKCWQ